MSKDDLSRRTWSLPVAVEEIPETGRHIVVSADVSTRAAIAKLAAVQAIARLEAEFDLTRHDQNGVHVLGSVSATVEQQCVVTLEPMESRIEEAIDLLFVPQGVSPFEFGSEEKRSPSSEPLEAMRDGLVDLAAIATEFLLLGIDPYPRKPGAVFKEPEVRETIADHPFAALAALKKGKSERDR